MKSAQDSHEMAGWKLINVKPNEDQIRALFMMNSALPRTTEEAKAVYSLILNLASPAPSSGTLEALREIQTMLNTAFGAGVYDIGPPAPGMEGSRAHSQSGYAKAILEITDTALASGVKPRADGISNLIDTIKGQLTSMMVGGCTCGAKTPDLQWHEITCTARGAGEILENVEHLEEYLNASGPGEALAQPAEAERAEVVKDPSFPNVLSDSEPYIESEPGEHQEVLDALAAHNSGEEQ